MLPALCFALLVAAAQQTTTQTTTQTAPGAQAAPRDSAKEKGTASIKGKVIAADTGKAMRRVQISLSSPDISESRSMSTTAQGLFEFKDLPAGRYNLMATRSGFLRLQYGQRRPGEPGRPLQIADGEHVGNADFALPRSGSISGHITDDLGDPLAGVNIYPAQWRYFRGKRRMVPISGGGGGGFNQTDDTGYFRISGLDPGDYFVLATIRTTWTVDDKPNERIGFLPTYSGGTANPAEAMRIKVAMGQEASTGDFPMVPGRVASISGIATYSSGQPMAGESVNMVQEFAGPNWSSQFGMPGSKINPDGSFLIKDVAPGEYRLSVRGPGDKDHAAEGVTVTVNLAGEDVAGVMLVGGTGGALSGRIVSDTGMALPLADSGRMRVSARPIDPTTTYQSSGDQDNGRVKDDWSFEVSNVFGQNRINVGPLPVGWVVRSIDYQGKDLADVSIDVRGGQRLDGVTVVLSKTLPKVRGTLFDDKGQPVEGTVLMFPEDAAKCGENSRLTRTARPDLAGGFEFRSVIPGTYLVVPLEYVRDGDWTDPEYLDTLREGAKRVQVDETGLAGLALTLKKKS